MPLEQTTWDTFKDQVSAAYKIDRAMEEIAQVRIDRRSGSQIVVCCPFHNEKNPSMSINVQQGVYYCHASGCGAKGNVFTFISEYLGIKYRDAVMLAAERVGIQTPDGMEKFDPSTHLPQGKSREQDAFSMMNPSELGPSDLIPALPASRTVQPNNFFQVWHPGGGRTPKPCAKKYRPEMVHEYRNLDGKIIFMVLRCRTKTNDKYFMPIRIEELPNDTPDFLVDDAETRMGWIVRGTTPKCRKPIYGLQSARDWVAKNKKILIIEGEKTCDAARRLISSTPHCDDILTLSPMGGGSATLYADWDAFMSLMDQETLDTLTFGVWPDADHEKTRRDGEKIDVQAKYVKETIGAFVIAARMAGLDPKKVTFTRATPGMHRKKGWDLADAEQEGWNGDRVIRDVFERGVRMAIDPEFLKMPVNVDETIIEPTAATPSLPQEILDILEEDVAQDTLEPDLTPEAKPAVLSADELAAQLFQDDISTPSIGLAGDMVTQIPDAEFEDIPHDGDGHHGDDDQPRNGDGEILDGHADAMVAMRDNPHFRCIGYRECSNYFLSLTSGQIFAINASSMKKTFLLSLAPLDFWQLCYVEFDNQGRGSINWDQAISDLISLCYEGGYWDPKKEAGKGARIDRGRVVFNTGDRIWIQQDKDGAGIVDVAANFHGDYHYTISDPCGLPDFENAFTASDSEPRALLDLISKINWRKENRNLSILGLFGWLAISPICGVLPWRPHLWLDGERSSGKSWIIQNIVIPVLGKYAITVKSNSTESGLRNILHSHAFPLVFDEAEGEMDVDKNRMAAILKLARHSATPGDSIVAQGVPGGNGQRYFSIASTFLLASITPQIEASADKTRFARSRLGPGHNLGYFARNLERPAMDLLTPEFSARMIARMVTRASSLKIVQSFMVQALANCGIERRMADVWGTLATGAWLLLEDGVPADEAEVLNWIEDTFQISEELDEVAAEIRDDKDHDRLFLHLMAHEMRCETVNLGVRTFNIGSIIEMAMHQGEEEDTLDTKQALKILANMGIRLGHGKAVAREGEKIDSLIIHKKSPRISEILAKTPYQKSYIDVMQQADGVDGGPVVRFGGLGSYRSISVPLSHFALGDSEET